MTFANSIIALKEGRIVETGDPEELLKRDGYVSKLKLAPLPDKEIEEEPAEADALRLSLQTTREAASILEEADDLPDQSWRRNGELSVYKFYFSRAGYWTVALYTLAVFTWEFLTEFSSKALARTSGFGTLLITQ